MDYAGILLSQLILLYLLSRQLQIQLSLLFHRIFKRQQLVMWMMAILFLPGTLIHELAHLIVARLLLVKAGNLSIIPRKTGDGSIRMGSVEMPMPDPIRRFVIGVAPVFVGISLLLFIMWWSQEFEVLNGWIESLVVGYAVFQIANCLFASRKDMEGSFILFAIIGAVVGGAYWLGWRPSISTLEHFLKTNQPLITQAVDWLWLPIIIDATIVAPLWLLQRVWSR